MSRKQDTTKRAKREHLNAEERKIIERMLRAGASRRQIADVLLRDKSTIKREIRRGTVTQRKRNPYESKRPDHPEYIEYKRYFADSGQQAYEAHRQNCGGESKLCVCADLVGFVESKILSAEKWSPDAAIGYAVANKLFAETFTTKTFYNWIEAGLVRVESMDLLLKVRRKQKSPQKKRKRALGKSIDKRPKEVESRQEFGHWEGDGIVGKGQQGHLITLVERKTGMGLLFNVQTKESIKIVDVLTGLKAKYGERFSQIFKTVTFDNGTEFSASDKMEQTGTRVYYAHPYSSWERGSNENWNGIVRRFVPKGSSFDKLTDKDMQRISHYINTLPRKRFGYRTPQDLWKEEIRAIMKT